MKQLQMEIMMTDMNSELLKMNLEDRFMDEFINRLKDKAIVEERDEYRVVLYFPKILAKVTIENFIFNHDSTSFLINIESTLNIKYLGEDTNKTHMTKDRVVFYLNYLMDMS